MATKEEYMISGQKCRMSFLEYQLVFCVKDGVRFIKSFNIIRENKILRKIYLKEMLPVSTCQNPEEMIVAELFKITRNIGEDIKTNKTSFKKRSKSKVNKSARDKAAGDLFSNLGL